MPGTHSRAGHGSGRLLPAVLLAGGLMLAACGSAATTGSSLTSTTHAGRPGAAVPADQPATASAALCADPAAAGRVVIARSPTLERSGPPRVVLSAQTTVTDAGRVRALAQALCALPRMSTRIMCPMLVEGTYTLWFSAAGHRYPAVRIQESGCEEVTGLGPPRTVATSSRFWLVLARAAQAGSTISPRPVYLPETQQGTGCSPASRHSTGSMLHCPGPNHPAGNAVGPVHMP